MNLFSRLTLWWVTPLVRLGYKRRLEQDDLWELQSKDDANALSETFLTLLEDYRDSDGLISSKAIWKVFRRMFWEDLLKMMISQLFYETTRFAGPVLLHSIVEYISDPNRNSYSGYIYACGLFLSQLIGTIFQSQSSFRAVNIGLRARNALSLATFRHVLKLDNGGRETMSNGEVLNLLTTDVQVPVEFMRAWARVWCAPLTLTAGIVYIYFYIGYSVLFGLILMVLFVPITLKVGKVQTKLQGLKMKATDLRVKHVTETMLGIKVLKLNAWEGALLDVLNQTREQEMKSISKLQYYRGLTMPFAIAIPNIASVITFASYILLGNELGPARAFTVVAAFVNVRSPFVSLPIGIMTLSRALVSENRFCSFFSRHERQAPVQSSFRELYSIPKQDDSEYAVYCKDASFIWNAASFKLEHITMNVPKGALVAIVGRVGDGKSSLCSALLGEMTKTSGSFEINGSLALCTQEPFIMNRTLRDNILFESPMERERYDATLAACALVDDLVSLPGGDLTEIGERGINISGGQKSRVALARAVYSNSDVYILDDVLSAVDAHVGKHIFNECVTKLLKNTTRIFITNQLHLLDKVDHVIMMEQGRIVEQGAFKDFQGDPKSQIWSLYEKSNAIVSNEIKEEQVSTTPSAPPQDIQDDDKNEKKGKLVEKESRGAGSGLKYSLLKEYWYAGTGSSAVLSLSLLGVFVLTEICFLSIDSWLAWWSQQPPGKISDQTFLGIYFGLTAAFFLILCVRAISFAAFAIEACRSLYYRLQNNVFYLPMSFFWQEPLGRVINRLTKDTNDVDVNLPLSWQWFLMTTVRVFGILAIIAWSSPYFLIGVVPLGILYSLMREYYRRTSRELQRLESVLRSPVYSHFSETLLGATTVRAYDKTATWLQSACYLVNWNYRAKFAVETTQIWLSMRLEVLGALVVLSTGICVVATSVEPGLAGLALAYSLNIVINLNMTVQQATLVESQMNAVERIVEYIDLPIEKQSHDEKMDKSWPHEGHVIFESVSLSYRENLEPAVTNLNVDIPPGTKVGIVGTTGSGKSTIMVILFRLHSISSGRVLIDGIDISNISVHLLRSRITCIPQDPVLFSTTFRKNIDPFDQYDDDAIWKAVDSAHLRSTVDAFPSGLETMITGAGANISVGQRQLICIARATLRNSGLIMMDEATASIDSQTDAIIQDRVRNGFPRCTMLIIAHRLETVLDLDKIMVMDHGTLCEYGDTATLLKIENGMLAKLVQSRG